MTDSSQSLRPAEEAPRFKPLLHAVIALVVPGAGHVSLGRPIRGLVFFALIMFSLVLGVQLDGKLFVTVPDQPLSRLATIASMGMGVPYFVLRYSLEYSGDIRSVRYEYGTAFILTAGLMNLLVILDTWDIASGRKR